MKILFKELTLHDFKGLRDFSLTFDDDVTRLYGDNAQGKTTIVHSLFWLFFGKDANGSSKFELFPLDEDNNTIPDTTPTVTLKFIHGAKENVYSRSKQGSKSVYTINDAKVTATEFKRHVGSVVTEELFSALLSPVYFGDNYSWQKQRDTILNNMKFENTVIDEFEYEDVAKEILDIGVEKTIEKYDKEKKALEKSKEQYIGTRDYLANKLQGVDTSLTEEELVKQVELKKQEIKDSEKILDSIHPMQSKVSELEREIQRLENEKLKQVNDKLAQIKSIEMEIRSELNLKKSNLTSKITALKTEIKTELDTAKRELESQIKSKRQDMTFETKSKKNKLDTQITSAKKELAILRGEYTKKLKELEEVKDECPLCGSKLDEFETANQKAILTKSADEIKLQGVTKGEEVKALELELSATVDDVVKLDEIKLLENELFDLKPNEEKQAKVIKLEADLVGLSDVSPKRDDVKALEIEVQELKDSIVAVDEKVEVSKLELDIKAIQEKVDYTKIQALRDELSAIEKQVNEYEFIVKEKLDLDKTTASLRAIMGDYDDCEDIIDAVKQYRTDYAQMIADVLNSKLDRVKIKTFEVAKNGEIKDTFQISMDGVPYASLNSAGKIEAGIELILLLSSSLEICFPIVIDNKESITKDFDIENQLITLSVQKGAKLGAD